MEVDIPYGKGKIRVRVPEDYEILVPKKVKIEDKDKLIKQALKKYREFDKNADKLLVIVNDATKPTPTPRILEYLYPYLRKHSDVRFLVATGTHKNPTEEQYRIIFGRFYDIFKEKIFVNDARKKDNMRYLGRSKNGTEVSINKLVFEMKNIIVIGSVEPHYFAGYTGGRKAFIPGVASYETTAANHRFAMDRKAHSLALEGNPVHEDMMDCLKLIKDINVFSIQSVLTINHDIYAVTSGDLNESFYEAVEHAKQIYGIPLEKKANIVISVAPYPMDINLYQSQHSLENGSLALEKDGVIILVSKCRMGTGNDNFLKILEKADTHQEVLDIIDNDYMLGSHKASRISDIGTWAHMWAVTNLDDETIKKSKLKPYHDLQKSIDDAVLFVKSKGKKPRVIIIPSGNLTVPLI